MNIDEYISSGIIEQYVLGMCSNEEKNELELLRKKYPVLQKAITDFELSFEQKMMANSVMSSTETDAKIFGQLSSLKEVPVVSINNKPIKNYGWLRGIAAAAIVFLGISGAFNYLLYTKNKEQKEALSAVKNLPVSLPVSNYTILKDPSITPIAMYGVGYHAICRCTMFWDKKTKKMYIMIHHLPKSSDTKDYQLWAMVDGKPVSIGIVNDAIRDRFIEMPNVPDGAIAFTVTLEKAGGTNTPTMDEAYLQGKISS